jgi:hypothetical protein
MKDEPHLGTFDASPVTRRAELDQLIAIVMSWGWPHAISFVAALQLRTAGYSAAQVRWMFQDGLRRVQ